ncbi:SCP2 sterol-binding domain-containing protein [Chloroflexi bacterium TSY]|nr:SCP2 sterol-binding domain-containing protein [Chloroflexi bacterium TSY]
MSNEITPAIIFQNIAKRIAKNASLGDINAVFQFNLTGDNGGTWAVDLKSDPPNVSDGEADAANCTISMTDEDFVALATGSLNATSAFMQGKVKVEGNMMLAMKLQKLMG